MELRKIATTLWKWAWLIALATVVAAGSSWLVVRDQPPVYRTSTTLMVGQTIQEVSPDYSEFYTAQQLAQTYSELIKREPILKATAAALGFEEQWRVLQGQVTAALVAGTQLMEVGVIDTDPVRAKRIADEVARQLIAAVAATRPQGSSQAFIQEQVKTLPAKIEAAQKEIADLEAELGQTFSAREIQDLQSRINVLESQVNNWRSTFAQYQLLLGDTGVNVLTVIEEAPLPTHPIGSQARMQVMLAAAVGLMLAVGAAFLIEYLDDTVKTPDDVERKTGLSTLGSIIRFPGTNGAGPLTALEPRSAVAEGYRVLRTNLQFAAMGVGQSRQPRQALPGTPGGAPEREAEYRPAVILLVTSAQPGEGKTTTVANLGVSLAQAGRQVLLVDADLRRPALHRLFNLSKEAGLTTLLLERDADIEHVIRKTGVDGLRVLPSGPVPANPAEVLGFAEMGALLERLRTMADYVLLDVPPVLSAADTSVLAQKVDGSLLVVEVGRTRTEMFERATAVLQNVKARVLGAILTKVDVGRGGRSYDYYYYYSRYYDREERVRKRRVRPGPEGILDRLSLAVTGFLGRWRKAGAEAEPLVESEAPPQGAEGIPEVATAANPELETSPAAAEESPAAAEAGVPTEAAVAGARPALAEAQPVPAAEQVGPVVLPAAAGVEPRPEVAEVVPPAAAAEALPRAEEVTGRELPLAEVEKPPEVEKVILRAPAPAVALEVEVPSEVAEVIAEVPPAVLEVPPEAEEVAAEVTVAAAEVEAPAKTEVVAEVPAAAAEAEEVVAEVPAAAADVEVPAEEVLAEVPAAAAGVEVPAEEVLAEAPAAAAGVEAPAEEVVAEMPAAAAGAEVPAEEVLAEMPAAAAEVEAPVPAAEAQADVLPVVAEVEAPAPAREVPAEMPAALARAPLPAQPAVTGQPLAPGALYARAMEHYRQRNWPRAREELLRLKAVDPARPGLDALIDDVEQFIQAGQRVAAEEPQELGLAPSPEATVSGSTPETAPGVFGTSPQTPARVGEAGRAEPRAGRKARPERRSRVSLWQVLALLLLLVSVAGGALVYAGVLKLPRISLSFLDNRAQTYINRGYDSFTVDDYQAAMENFNKALQLDPDNEEAKLGLQHATQYLELRNLYTQARALMETKSFDEAIAKLQAIIAADPWYEDADLLLQQCENAKKLEDLYKQALSYYNAGDWSKAADGFEALQGKGVAAGEAEVSSKLFDSYLNEGRQQVVAADSRSAIIRATLSFNSALALFPDDAAAQQERQLASLYLDGYTAYERADWRQAAGYLARLLASRADYAQGQAARLLCESYTKQGDAYQANGQLQPALDQYRLVLTLAQCDSTEVSAKIKQVEALFAPTPTPGATR